MVMRVWLALFAALFAGCWANDQPFFQGSIYGFVSGVDNAEMFPMGSLPLFITFPHTSAVFIIISKGVYSFLFLIPLIVFSTLLPSYLLIAGKIVLFVALPTPRFKSTWSIVPSREKFSSVGFGNVALAARLGHNHPQYDWLQKISVRQPVWSPVFSRRLAA